LKIQTGEEEHALENPVNEAPALVAAPRHLRRRAFHEEIPDTLLVPDVQPYTLTRAEASPARRTKPSPDKRTARDLDSRESAYRRKRLVALLVVIAVSLSIPILVIALVFVR
jgi:hypothetical protein